jgi:hypothetical protein
MSTPTSTRTNAPEAAAPPDAWTQRGGKQEPPSRWKTVLPSRRVPYLLLGVVLVIACAAAAVIVSMHLDNRQQVLALSRPVMVGHLLSTQDLHQVLVSTDGGLDSVPAGEQSTVVGRPAAFSLPTGALLTRGSVGAPAIPVDGQAVAAVALKAGQFPPVLAPGARVAVLVAASTPAAGTQSSSSAQVIPVAQWTATVTDVGPCPDQQSTVVSLQLQEANARQLATAPSGQISLVALSGGGN